MVILLIMPQNSEETVNMYIPLDPNKVSNFWEKFKQDSLTNKSSYLIIDGKKNPETKQINVSLDVANKIIDRMKKADYVRLGSSRLMPIPTHFAVNFYDLNKGILLELITVDDKHEEVSNAIHLVIQLSFYENSTLMELTIPMIIDGIDEPDVNIVIDSINQCMVIKRKN